VEDINAIKITCSGLGLRADSPLEAASYENEEIEGWWEESHGQKELRMVPSRKKCMEAPETSGGPRSRQQRIEIGPGQEVYRSG
jgi:hypothetical protein